MKLNVALRLIEIQRVLVRHGLDEFVRETRLYRPLRFVFLLSPWTWFERRKAASRGERLRLALEELGPIFVKFGQAVSTRRDLLPDDIANELAKLQDRVPPFDGDVARAAIETAYGKPISDMFESFETTPLAAASIAQVPHDRTRQRVDLLAAGRSQRDGLKDRRLRRAVLADEDRPHARRPLVLEVEREVRDSLRVLDVEPTDVHACGSNLSRDAPGRQVSAAARARRRRPRSSSS